MKRRSLLICVLILMQIFVTGCWSRRELNDLAIAVGIGIDKIGDQYQVSAQVVLPSQIAGSKGALLRHQSTFIKRREIPYMKPLEKSQPLVHVKFISLIYES